MMKNPGILPRKRSKILNLLEQPNVDPQVILNELFHKDGIQKRQ